MRRVELKIVNSKIFLENGIVEAGVAVDKGKIVRIAKDPNLPPSDTTIDSRKMLMLPGVVDVHVHLRDMNLSYKEDFSSGTEAAVIGGVTTVLDMPNTFPPTTNAERLREKISKASNMIYSNVGFFGAFPLEPNEASKIMEEGAVGFKLYLNDPQYDSFRKEPMLTRSLRLMKSSDCLVAIHAEFQHEQREKREPSNLDGEIRHFVSSHAPQLEVDAVSMCAKAARESSVHIHICHLSTEMALNIINGEKGRQVPLTTEVTPHHLLLSDEELYHFGSYAKMVPPLRTKRDCDSLMRGLTSGAIDIIASDHAPHANVEKDEGFADAPSGIPGLETMLSLILTEMTKGRITLKRIVQTMSENPSRSFNLKNIGKISEGYNADLTLVDLAKEKTIDAQSFHSKAKYTPFEGRLVKGIPVLTIVNGIPVMQDGEIIGKPGSGRIVKHVAVPLAP
ncbi:MAG: dihydroorotase family protein [Candidatus Atabeyarchaeum deiterrae]